MGRVAPVLRSPPRAIIERHFPRSPRQELVAIADRTRLCTWDTISDEELSAVLANPEAGATARVRHDAMNFVRLCLQGDAARRPTIAQVCPPSAIPTRARSHTREAYR